MTTLQDITIFNDIRERLEAVTEEQIRLVADRLDDLEPTDKVVGKVHVHSMALHTLGYILASEAALERAKGAGLMVPELAADHQEKAMIAEQIEDAVRELMWAQMRSDLGFWKPCDIAVKKGWLLVEHESKNPMERLMINLGRQQ